MSKLQTRLWARFLTKLKWFRKDMREYGRMFLVLGLPFFLIMLGWVWLAKLFPGNDFMMGFFACFTVYGYFRFITSIKENKN